MPTPKRSLRGRDPRGVPQSFDSVRGASATPRLDASRRTDIASGTIRGSATRVRRASRPTQAEQETVLRWDRGDDYVHVWFASPVTWAEARPARHPADPGDDLSGRAVSGRGYGIPISRYHWRFKRGGTQAPGRRVAARSSDSSAPPTRSPYRSWANHAPEPPPIWRPRPGWGRVGAPVPHRTAGTPSFGGGSGAVTRSLWPVTNDPDSGDAGYALSPVPAREPAAGEVLRGVRQSLPRGKPYHRVARRSENRGRKPQTSTDRVRRPTDGNRRDPAGHQQFAGRAPAGARCDRRKRHPRVRRDGCRDLSTQA
jgi:hypothetical protein